MELTYISIEDGVTKALCSWRDEILISTGMTNLDQPLRYS